MYFRDKNGKPIFTKKPRKVRAPVTIKRSVKNSENKDESSNSENKDVSSNLFFGLALAVGIIFLLGAHFYYKNRDLPLKKQDFGFMFY